jgi:4-amino-4-deoxy-L-arabinose transferase-like glycosyltransferase
MASAFAWMEPDVLSVRRGAVVAGLFAVMALAALLRLWDIERAGLGNLFYASAVRSMGLSWHNFLYAAYDPAGTITVDKPPLALWLQVAATKTLGFEGFPLHLPTALAGIAAVPLTFAAARRGLGVPTALAAALVLAIFPESVATARDTTMDALVLALLAGGAWLLVAAVEGQSTRLLLAWAVLMGLLFNVKMFEGFVVGPAAALYLLVRWRGELRRLAPSIALAAAAGVVVAASWLAFVDLTPAEARPRVMNSRANSAFDLALRYNGLERVLPGEVIVFQPLPGASTAQAARSEAAARRFGVGEAGPLRLVTGSNGPLLGATALLALAGLGLAGWRRRDWLRGPGLFWAGWGVTGLVLFSASNRAAAHYAEAFAPALAVLAAVALVEGWRLARGWRALVLPALVVLVAAHAWYAASSHLLLRDRLEMAALLALGGSAAAVLVTALARWSPRRVVETARAAPALAVLGVPLAVSAWVATDAPAEGRVITLPNPVAYASNTPPEPAQPLPVNALLAFPASEGARYRLAIDGISKSGELTARTGASSLAIWNEFLREPVLDRSTLEALIDAGDVPWVLLSRPLADTPLLKELRATVEARCTPFRGSSLGPGWLIYRCPSAAG